MGKLGTWVAGHRKTIAGAVSAIGGVLALVAAHQEWGTVAQYAAIGVAVLGAAGVYRVPNADDNKPATRAPAVPGHPPGR